MIGRIAALAALACSSPLLAAEVVAELVVDCRLLDSDGRGGGRFQLLVQYDIGQTEQYRVTGYRDSAGLLNGGKFQRVVIEAAGDGGRMRYAFVPNREDEIQPFLMFEDEFSGLQPLLESPTPLTPSNSNAQFGFAAEDRFSKVGRCSLHPVTGDTLELFPGATSLGEPVQ